MCILFHQGGPSLMESSFLFPGEKTDLPCKRELPESRSWISGHAEIRQQVLFMSHFIFSLPRAQGSPAEKCNKLQTLSFVIQTPPMVPSSSPQVPASESVPETQALSPEGPCQNVQGSNLPLVFEALSTGQLGRGHILRGFQAKHGPGFSPSL